MEQDKRLVDMDGFDKGAYEENLKTLKCCVCGSREPCDCTDEQFRGKGQER